MKSNLKKFQKKPFFLSVSLFILACFIFLFLYREIKNNNEMSGQNQIAWQAEADRREELKVLERSLKTIEQERALLDTHFIRSSDVVPFLDMVERRAPEVGAEAQVSLVDILKDNSGLLVEVRATGSFSAVYKFLTLLENSPYEIEFISMNIQQSGSVDESEKKVSAPQWSAIFKMKLLSFLP